MNWAVNVLVGEAAAKSNIIERSILDLSDGIPDSRKGPNIATKPGIR